MTERLTEDYYDDMQKITRHSAKSDNIDLNTGGNDFQNIIDKLAEYETAEDEGRLVVLPCKSGQDLFGIYNGAIVDGYADGYLMEKISVDSNSEHWIWFQDKYSKNFWKVSFEDFGKTIFLIREEAEKALKEVNCPSSTPMD